MMMRMRIVVVFFPPDMFRWQVPVVLVLFEDILKMMAWASLDKDSRLPETSQEPLCPEVLAVPPWCLAAETRDATPRLSLLTRFRPKIGTLNSQIPLLWAKTQKPSGLIFFFLFFLILSNSFNCFCNFSHFHIFPISNLSTLFAPDCLQFRAIKLRQGHASKVSANVGTHRRN